MENKRRQTGHLLIFFFVVTSSPCAHAAFIDAINGSAAVPSNIWYLEPGNEIGWYYTPAINYTLEGISTNFGPTNSALVTPTITVQIQTERPINGGVVLGQGTFIGNSATGGPRGAMFPGVTLAAGTRYFVDFMGINGMGLNVGLWRPDPNGNPQPSDGATINLGARYIDSAGTTGFTHEILGGSYGTLLGENISLAEPVLNFSGVAIPEPSSVVLLAGAIIGFIVWSRCAMSS